MKKRVNIFDVPVDCLSMQETLNLIKNSINSSKKITHSGINAAKIIQLKENYLLKESIINSDIINADGQSIVWASKILGQPLPERVTGIDLMENLVKLSHENSYKIFFFGAEKEVVKKVVQIYSEKYSHDIIGGYRNGYYNEDEEKEIVEQILKSGSNILFIGITSPKQEIFMNKYKDKLQNVNLIMIVGGSFDVIAGKVKRAPVFMQKIGMEWFYRLIQEPRRLFKRYLVTNTKFLILLVREYIKLKLNRKQNLI